MNNRRFEAARQGAQYPSEYDFDTSLLNDLNSRDIAPLKVVTLSLATAGSQFFAEPGRAFVPYFFTTGSSTKARVTGGFVTCYVNQTDANNTNFALTAKHNRGYRGSYSQMYITWTAQAGVSVDLVFLKSRATPWMTDGIAPNQSGIGPLFNTNAITFASTPYTGAATDNFVSADATGGNIAVTTPPAKNGQTFEVVKKDATANTVTVTGMNGGGTITLRNQNDSISLWSDGTAWYPYA